MAWYSCNFVYDHILNIESDSHLIGKYQKNESRIKIIRIIDANIDYNGFCDCVSNQ